VISHIFIGVTDFDRALPFYRALMAALELDERCHNPALPRTGWHSAGGERPYFVICTPENGLPHHADNGQMVGFAASSRAHVVRVYDAATAAGATDEGRPGLRPQYHDHYFGAYFRDPEGNKLCVACHDPA